MWLYSLKGYLWYGNAIEIATAHAVIVQLVKMRFFCRSEIYRIEDARPRSLMYKRGHNLSQSLVARPQSMHVPPLIAN